MKHKFLILNGPNLNLLGEREPDQYGKISLENLEDDLRDAFPDLELSFFQSNHEGELVDCLHQAHHTGLRGIVFNPGAYTHTSVALRDAVKAISTPVIEVHLSNIYSREPFRHFSYLAPVCVGQISGLGTGGYGLAIRWLISNS
ncbi:MAG: type II 3-dehydroquinate dehydratase [Bacteroidetes bacterium]|nr:type II 3-dehydroquinate dehydratase [Bacteroidota bacterium]MCY4206233.1 type II 3-dehydroquinate dehydratase [Bacteroidota bacterium]